MKFLAKIFPPSVQMESKERSTSSMLRISQVFMEGRKSIRFLLKECNASIRAKIIEKSNDPFIMIPGMKRHFQEISVNQ